MKFFVFISLFSALLLGFTVQSGLIKNVPPPKNTPEFLKDYKQEIKDSFKRPENANILFSFLTGDKTGISPHTRKSLKKTNLSYLLSPSGIHLSGLLLLITYLLKKVKIKWIRKSIHLTVLSTFFLFPQFDSIRRLSLLRLLFQLKFISKIKVSTELIFILTFSIAFALGHYEKSPVGFIYSFIFLGTFFSLKNYSKFTIILGVFSTQLILGLFLGEKVSLISIPVGMLGSFLFTLIFPFLILFLATFWLIPINWGEPIIRTFIIFVRHFATLLNGSFTSSSLFLIAAVWLLMMGKKSSGKCVALLFLVFFHTNTAMTPVIFH